MASLRSDLLRCARQNISGQVPGRGKLSSELGSLPALLDAANLVDMPLIIGQTNKGFLRTGRKTGRVSIVA